MQSKVVIQKGNTNFYLEENRGILNVDTSHIIPKYITGAITGCQNYIHIRENSEDDLLKMLENDNSPINIYGENGSGKSEMVKQIFNVVEKDYKHIAWIDTRDGVKRILFSNKVLHESLGLTKELVDCNGVDECFEKVVNRMRRIEERGIIVFENAGEEFEHDDIYDRIRLDENWDIIIISEEKLERYERQIFLDKLSEKKAVKLFTSIYRYGNPDTNTLGEIVKKFGYNIGRLVSGAWIAEMRMYRAEEILEWL